MTQIFSTLHSLLSEADGILIAATRSGAELRLSFQALPGAKTSTLHGFSLVATPQELDAQLPEFLQGYESSVKLELGAQLRSVMDAPKVSPATDKNPARTAGSKTASAVPSAGSNPPDLFGSNGDDELEI